MKDKKLQLVREIRPVRYGKYQVRLACGCRVVFDSDRDPYPPKRFMCCGDCFVDNCSDSDDDRGGDDRGDNCSDSDDDRGGDDRGGDDKDHGR